MIKQISKEKQMASSEKKKRAAEEALETLDHIRMIGEEVRDYPELLFWCPTCGLPGSRSTGEWQACHYHTDRIVTCGLPACLRKVHRCRNTKEACDETLCPDCAKGTRAFKRCSECNIRVCDLHSSRVIFGDPTRTERVCSSCN